MRLALISDIHANRQALEAVLADIDAWKPGEIWCLGDVVGYGAEPDACTSLVAERCSMCLVGNHDLAVLGELDVSAFSPAAEEAVEWTRANCERSTVDFLKGLKPLDEDRVVGLYHASPRDPIWEYVLSLDAAAECLALQKQRVSFIGHSHVALHFSAPNGSSGEDADGDHAVPPLSGVRGAPALAGTELGLNDGRWLINPGSVGQPRDGDPRAAWLELDTESWTTKFRRVEYDIDAAEAAIVAAGLPEHLGGRLHVGQ